VGQRKCHTRRRRRAHVLAGVHMFWLDGDEIIGEDPWETPTAPLIVGGNLSPQVTSLRNSTPLTMSPSLMVTQRCTLLPETNFNGGDIAHTMAASVAECCNLCVGNRNCAVFTFESHNCWMKNAIVHKLVHQANHTAGMCNGRTPGPVSNGQTLFSTGPNDLVGTFFPYLHQLTFAEGIAREGLPPPAMLLSRATTAGSWRLGGASWDGDHHCGWDDYLNHYYNGLDAQLAGQLWWSVDVGGFFCQMAPETMCRDFMLAATTPIMRQHGNRDTRIWGPGWTPAMTACATKAIQLRQTLRNYTHAQLAVASRTGVPLQRYLWHDFPEDLNVWEVQDQFMFGPDWMMAPVLVQNATSVDVYFPGPRQQLWERRVGSAYQRYAGGSTVTIAVALDELAMFSRVPRDLSSIGGGQ